ncbi:HIT family protein [Viridibacillus arvi]|uniref:HIT family protein n=1 Tax=Viridibacillus arvi TaxID=263475 RepID=UPI0034CF5F35
MNQDCFICSKHKGEILTAGTTIFEDDYIYVGHIDKGSNPTYLGHIMIDLKRHTPEIGDMTADEAKAFGLIMTRVSKALMEVEGAEHVYSMVSGNSVSHLHMHIVPRYPNTPIKYWSAMELNEWAEAPKGIGNEINEVCLRIKEYLEVTPYD